MHVVKTVVEMQRLKDTAASSVGLVPTMGYLHEGHLSLVRRARAENEVVVVSIFVNPTQFGPGEDLERYPRDEARDLALLRAEGADFVFMPSVVEMYPPGFDEWVEVTGTVAERLEGAHRPGHFRGVTTVVARLFRIVRPERAYFGQKDAQQLRVIRQMTKDLALPVQIIGMPIVREADGLAMSSRNVYLSSEERAHALVLSHALGEAEAAFGRGERDAAVIRDHVRRLIASEIGVEPDYVSVADDETLAELEGRIEGAALVLVAARVGGTRLIDNVELVP